MLGRHMAMASGHLRVADRVHAPVAGIPSVLHVEPLRDGLQPGGQRDEVAA